MQRKPIQSIWSAALGGQRQLLIVAGSVASAKQIHDLACAGADAFTIGSAIFDGSTRRTISSPNSRPFRLTATL